MRGLVCALAVWQSASRGHMHKGGSSLPAWSRHP